MSISANKRRLTTFLAHSTDVMPRITTMKHSRFPPKNVSRETSVDTQKTKKGAKADAKTKRHPGGRSQVQRANM